MGKELFSYWLCALLVILPGKRTVSEAQEDARWNDEALSKIPIKKFHDLTNNTLVLQEPIQMSLEGGEWVLFGVEVLLKEEITPDVLITLMVSNPGGDSDIFCNTWSSLQEVGRPGVGNAPWGSNHTQGDDVIFISRTSPAYIEEDSFEVEVDGVPATAKRFVCLLHGAESEASDTTVEIEVAYEYRELVEKEEQALLSMCRMCCSENSPCPCIGYNRDIDQRKEFLGGTEFCHEIGNVCTDDGHLLHLSMNKFNLTCEFPLEQIVQLEFLAKLDISSNQLTGNADFVAQGLSAMRYLKWLHLARNKLSEEMPPDGGICSLASGGLIYLNLAVNEIQGTIPNCLIDEDTTLHEFHLDKNQLTGSLPDFGTNILEVLSISRNNLMGTIPNSLGEVENLRGIRLSGNKLEGSIPSTLGLSKTLLVAHFDNNLLSGRIPDSISAAAGLREIWLFNNSLTSLPSAWEFGPMSSQALTYLDLTNNSIRAGFPMGLASSPGILVLSIAENNFFGPLPQTEGLFPSGVLLQLSHNEFNGSIPEEFGTIGWFGDQTLQNYPNALFDLSYNNLEGEIPAFLYHSERAPFIGTNLILDGNQLTCSEPEKLRSTSSLPCLTGNEREGRKKKSVGAKVATIFIVIVIVVVLLALIIVIVVIGTMRRRRAKQFEGIVGEMSMEPSIIKESTKQIAAQV